MVHTFSVIGAVMYAFSTSPAFTSNSLRDARVRAIRTDSRDTTLEYVMHFGISVALPPATSRALRRNDSILTSNII